VIWYAVTVITIYRFCASPTDAAPAMACINWLSQLNTGIAPNMFRNQLLT